MEWNNALRYSRSSARNRRFFFPGVMSLDTLLEAAKFLESSSTKGTSKDDSAIARGMT